MNFIYIKSGKHGFRAARTVIAVTMSALLVFALCACGQRAPSGRSLPAAELPEFGAYTGLTEFLSNTADDPVVRVVYRPGMMGGSDELYVTEQGIVDAIVNALKKVSINGFTYSTVTDWYPSITLETENGASLSFSFDGEWLAGSQVNYTLSGIDAVWKLIKANASEPEPLQYGDFLYELLEDGSAEITGYCGNGGVVEIPDTLDGYTVTSIGYKAFYGCDEISEISFPETISSIGRQAFAYCDGLLRLQLSCPKLTILSEAFEYCDYLSEIAISGENVCIESGAFHYCGDLRMVEFNTDELIIERVAFEYCRGLSEVSLAGTQSVEINKAAFAYCDDVSFIVSEGSAAEAFCKDNQLPYTAA